MFAIFTENDCTDILAMPDAGGIKAIKSKLDLLIERTVDNDINAWFGETPASKGLRRITLLKSLGAAWEWFRTEHTDLPHRLALRTGQIFRLQDDRIAQFENCNFRGYTTADHKKKNPFADKDFEVAM